MTVKIVVPTRGSLLSMVGSMILLFPGMALLIV
jgi:hypothetical protein